MIGKYNEKINFILDLGKCKVPMKKEFIKTMISLLNDNWGSYIKNVFIYRPSKFFTLIWNFVTALGMVSKRDLDVVRFVKDDEKHLFNEICDPNDMPELYGGVLSDEPHYNGFYWPPRPSTQCTEGKILTRKDIEDNKLVTFDILGPKADKTIMTPIIKIEW